MAHSPVGRVADSMSNRHWSSFLIELVLIVAGILIALQIDNWVTDRENRHQERSYLRSLLVDLDTIEAEIESKLSYEAAFANSAEIAMQMIEGRNQDFDVDKFAGLISTLTMRKTTRLDSPAFVEIVSSGGLTLIRDDEIRSAILNYFAFAERIELVLEKNSQEFVDRGFVPVVRAMGFGTGTYSGLNHNVPHSGRFDSVQNRLSRRALEALDEQSLRKLEVHVHWREVVAYEDSFIVIQARDETQALRAQINEYLNEI